METAPNSLVLYVTTKSSHLKSVTRVASLLFLTGFFGVVAGHMRKVEWTSKLNLKNLSSIESRLGQPFGFAVSVMKDSKSVTVSNCNEYLKSSDLHFPPPSDRDTALLRFNGVDCQAIRALGEAKQSKTSYLVHFHLDSQAADYLPPTLAPAVSGEDSQNARDAEARGLSWRQFQPGLTLKPDKVSLLAEESGGSTRLEIYGHGDFDRDGVEDILLRADVSFIKGTYTDSRLFLLTRKSPNSQLTLLREYK
jgi:hypothetical protein